MRHPRSNVRHPRSNVRHPRSNVRHPRSNVRHPQSNSRHPRSNARHPQSNSRHPRSNARHPQSNARHPQSNMRHPRSNVRISRDEAIVDDASHNRRIVAQESCRRATNVPVWGTGALACRSGGAPERKDAGPFSRTGEGACPPTGFETASLPPPGTPRAGKPAHSMAAASRSTPYFITRRSSSRSHSSRRTRRA